MDRVTAAVVLYNGAELIGDLRTTLSELSCGAVIYDSGSVDGSAELARALPSAPQVIAGENRGFGHGNNRCLERIGTEYTLLLNSDASISSDSLERLAGFLDRRSDIASVQPLVRLWGWDMVTAGRGVYLTGYGESWDAGFMHLEPALHGGFLETPAVTAAAALWRTSVLRELGGFDQGYFMYFEDADLALRARAAGWGTGVLFDAQAVHRIGASSSRESASLWELRSSVRLYRRFLSPSGRLDRRWWQRELRTAAGMLARGRNPMKRISCILKASGEPVNRVQLPDTTINMLYGQPGDMPLHRPDPNEPGPGWRGGRVSPWAGIPAQGGELSLTLRGTGSACTGAVLSGEGDVLARFTLSPQGMARIALAEAPAIVYIKCDSANDSITAEVE